MKLGYSRKCLSVAGLIASLSVFAGSSQAAVFLMDFNTAAASGAYADYPGGASAWNIYAAPSNINGSAIADTTGSSAAGITLSVAGTCSDTTRDPTTVFTNPAGGPAWVTTDGSLDSAAAAGDYFYTSTNGAIQSFTLTFGGLTAGQVVSLDLWMSRLEGNGGEGYFDYSLDGGNTWSAFSVLEKDGTPATANGWDTHDTLTQPFAPGIDGNVNARYMHAGSIVLTGSSLDVRVTDSPVSTWTGLGAARLTTVVPEPASIGLIGLGAIALMRRRHA